MLFRFPRIVILAVFIGSFESAMALAQAARPAASRATPQSTKPAAIAVKQIALSEKQVANYTPCWKELNAFTDADYSVESPARKAEMEHIARKHGYSGFDELGFAGQNITWCTKAMIPSPKNTLDVCPICSFRSRG